MGKRKNLVAVGMMIGSLPLSAFILLFFNMMAARRAGHPYGGDALGLMMMSLFAYGLALVSCIVGVAYFGSLLFRKKSATNWWQIAVLVYSLGQVIGAMIYFSWI